MDQQHLFFERIEDAIGALIAHLGGRKKIGQLLMPEKTIADAQTWVSAALNPERREKFSPEQLLLLARMGREAGCDLLMDYLASEAGYARPEPLEPADEVALAQREFVDAVERLDALSQRITRLHTKRVA